MIWYNSLFDNYAYTKWKYVQGILKSFYGSSIFETQFSLSWPINQRENLVPKFILQLLYHNCNVEECKWWRKNCEFICKR